MVGNVWAWTEDCEHGDYKRAPTDGSPWLADNGGECKNRIGRGGSWSNTPTPLRSAYRDGNTADARLDNLGVRVARTLDVP